MKLMDRWVEEEEIWGIWRNVSTKWGPI